MKVLKLKSNTTDADKNTQLQILKNENIDCLFIGEHKDIILIKNADISLSINSLPYVDKIMDDVPKYVLSSRQFQQEDTVITVGEERIGDGNLCIIAGPCSVESEEQLNTIAGIVADKGIKFLRGGAYKPRTNPYSFRGLKSKGLEILYKAKQKYGLKVVTEVMSIDRIDEVADVADVLQVGSRNMFHYALLDELGKIRKPILLKRGMAAQMTELLQSSEYILNGGNKDVMLCERGIKTFETATRNTLDLNVVPNLKQHSHLPVIVDPSHGTGVRSLVTPMSLAAIAGGVDGLEIEVHNKPELALSDGAQSLLPEDLDVLMRKIKVLQQTMGEFR